LDATAQHASAFAARSLIRAARWASLATAAPASAGALPFASLVTHAVAPDGTILMLLSGLARHAGHLRANPNCAIMATGEPENLNWQTAPRLTVQGEASISEDAELFAYWLARHPYARLYAGFADFSLWRLVPRSALFVIGFGLTASLAATDLEPDPAATAALAAAQSDLLAYCNHRHAESLSRLAHARGGSGRWRALGLDPDGLDLVQDEAVMRIAFPAPVADGAAAQAALLELFEMARRHF
jgi:putative heme iron utilization protein